MSEKLNQLRDREAWLPESVDSNLENEAAGNDAGEGDDAGDGDEAGDGDDDTPSLPERLTFPNFCDPPVSPLVLDLDGDGIELIALSASRTLFDLDEDSYAQHTGWVAPDDALLALDRNGNGRIDDIAELFGNATTDGFTELKTLDSNKDGTINAQDTKFSELRLWRDLNGNGVSEANELQSLADAGIVSIDLNAATSDTTIAGHRISHTSTFTKTGGTTGTIVDAWFENDRHISAYLPADGFTLHADVKVLPNLTGYGVVPSLSIAMTLDAGLRTLVTNLMRESDTLSPGDFRARVLQIVLDWTGADTVDSHSRGPNMDAWRRWKRWWVADSASSAAPIRRRWPERRSRRISRTTSMRSPFACSPRAPFRISSSMQRTFEFPHRCKGIAGDDHRVRSILPSVQRTRRTGL